MLKFIVYSPCTNTNKALIRKSMPEKTKGGYQQWQKYSKQQLLPPTGGPINWQNLHLTVLKQWMLQHLDTLLQYGLFNAKSHLATKELLAYFNDELSKQINLELSHTSAVFLSCDTCPYYLLRGIADLVWVKVCLFPYHRNMWITPTSVRIQDGYSAETDIEYIGYSV